MKLKLSFPTILVVDDTPSNLQVLFAYLENAGFKVLLAQNGNRALEIIRACLPDLILLDVLMPEINGFDLCRQLKEQPQTKNIPIIFLTALSETNSKIQGFAVGGVDYITKPIEQQEVVARIKTHLALKTTKQDLTQRNQELESEIQQRQEIEQQLQQAFTAESSIQRITTRIRDSLDEKQVLQTVAKELATVLAPEDCQIEFYDPDRSIFPHVDREASVIVTTEGAILASATGIVKQIADCSKVYRQLLQLSSLQLVTEVPKLGATTDVAAAGINRSSFYIQKNSFTYNCLICPIFDYQEPINIMGNLWLLRSPEEIFTQQEVRLVEQIASQCAIAIRQARLYHTSQVQIAELAKLNRLKDDFLKTISHELRSPMSSIQLAVQTLEKILLAESTNSYSATFQRVLQIFRQASERQNQLVDDLLTLCYLDAQSETIVTNWIELKTWIPEIINTFNNQINNQEQTLVVDIDPQIAAINTDPFILERVVRELINNACKYTPAREEIRIQLQHQEQKVLFAVTNTGITIDEVEQKRIFDRFYRIPSNDPWKYGGTGLGLYLVKRLLELIRGSISVASENNTTKFFIELSYQFE